MKAPQNLDAEKSVVGSMLISTSAIDEALTKLNSSDFYDMANARIFEVIANLVNDNKPVDTVTVIERLTKTKYLKAVGGAYYITGLANNSGIDTKSVSQAQGVIAI